MKEWILLFVLSFLPPLIYMVWIRNTERCQRQTWKSILLCFLWGASLAIIAAIILEIILNISLVVYFDDTRLIPLLTVVVVAPIAEEFAKPLALRIKTVKREIAEPEDGLIYGAVAGLGFSATENLFYGWDALMEGIAIFLVLISIRSIAGCLLHASATAWTGYGYGKTLLNHTSLVRVIPYFLLAIFLHGFYNFVVSFEVLGTLLALGAAFLFVIISIYLVRSKIQTLDEQNC